MDKLVGFTISKDKIGHEDVDVFARGLNVVEFERHGFNIYLWGIGDIKKCLISDKYTLSFPLSDNLLDRNALIYSSGENIVVENDWLASIPIFYNEKESIVSTLPLKVLRDKTIDPEGLNIYFEFGYCAFGYSPFADVKLLRYFSRIVINADKLSVENKDDPITQKGLFNKVSDEKEALEKITKYITNVEANTKGEIIISTSGGYDSRLLNFLIKDKSRIRSFTYGLSRDQSRSNEVIYARELAKSLKLRWEQVELGCFYKYINDWFRLYGFSTHLHGMYQIEFYRKIIERYNFSRHATFLSGIIGDGWSGRVRIDPLSGYKDLLNIGYTHGNNFEMKHSLLKGRELIKKDFFKNFGDLLTNQKVRIVMSMRFKLVLLSYLASLPEYFGFPVWTPFLEFDTVVSMLNIDEKRRRNRIWQRDFFLRNHLDVEAKARLIPDKNNYLLYKAFINHVFDPIDVDSMGKYISKEYLCRINYYMSNQTFVAKLTNRAFANRYIRSAGYRLLGLKPSYVDYTVIKSFEKALKN